MFGAGIGMTAFLTLLTPVAANTSIYLMVAIRIIEGIFEGVTYPCIHAIWARWAPVYERTRMSSIAYAGSYAGTVIAMPLSGLLAQYGGWESVFYVSGELFLHNFTIYFNCKICKQLNSVQLYLIC